MPLKNLAMLCTAGLIVAFAVRLNLDRAIPPQSATEFSETDSSLGPEGARVVAAPEQIELGIVRNGDVLDARFALANGLPYDISVDEIKGSCGCISTGRRQIRIASGATEFVPLRIEVRSSQGSFAKEVLVTYSYAGRQAHIRVPVTGLAAKDGGLLVQPQAIRFGEHERDEVASQVFTVTQAEDEKAGVLGLAVRSLPKWVKCSVVSVDDRSWNVHLTAEMPHTPGIYSEGISLLAERRGRPPALLDIPISATVLGSYISEPRQVVEALPHGTEFSASLEILPRSSASVGLERIESVSLEVTSGDARLTALKKKTVRDDSAGVLELRVRSTSSVSRGVIAITLSLANGEKEIVKVPLVIMLTMGSG